MIHRTLLIATAIIASGVITACSDMTGPAEMQSAGRASFAEGSRTCPAPGTGLPGALNMLHDPTMLTRPEAAQPGIDGMFHAVAVSGC